MHWFQPRPHLMSTMSGTEIFVLGECSDQAAIWPLVRFARRKRPKWERWCSRTPNGDAATTRVTWRRCHHELQMVTMVPRAPNGADGGFPTANSENLRQVGKPGSCTRRLSTNEERVLQMETELHRWSPCSANGGRRLSWPANGALAPQLPHLAHLRNKCGKCRACSSRAPNGAMPTNVRTGNAGCRRNPDEVISGHFRVQQSHVALCSTHSYVCCLESQLAAVKAGWIIYGGAKFCASTAI